MDKYNLYAGKAHTEKEQFNAKPVGISVKTDETRADMNLGCLKEDQDMKIWNMTNRSMATRSNRV